MEKAILLDNKHLDYDGIKWTLKAISKDKTRYTINLLNITKSDVVATDGCRLHNYFLKQPFENGLYESFCVPNKIILIQSPKTDYVDWKSLFLVDPPIKTIKVSATTCPKKLNEAYAKLIRLMNENQTFDLNYWNDILSFGKEYEVRWYGSGKSIIFINSTHRGVIMPMEI